MSAKRKLIVALISIIFVAIAVVATVSIVFALTDQTIVSSIDVGYSAVDIDGSVQASYYLGGVEQPLTPVGSRTDGDKLIFKAEDNENAGSLKFPDSAIVLDETNDYTLIIKYTYTNTGERHYIASMDFASEITNNNMIVEYGIQDSTMDEIKYSTNRFAVVVPSGATEKSYWIKITVDDKAYHANFSASLNWLLEGCDAQDKEYLSLDSIDFIGDETTNTYSAAYSGGYIPNGELVFPTEINGYDVTTISANPNLTTEKSLIKSVSIPESVTTIEDNAFDGYSNLEEVIFEQNLQTQSLSVQSSNGLTTIGNSAFANCSKLDNLTLPSTITTIGTNTFEKCFSLKQIVIPNGVGEIKNSTFKDCSSLVNVTMSEVITSIGNSAFSGCSELINLNMPKDIETIGESAFENCARFVGELDLYKATTIGANAFAGCASLTKFMIGPNVSNIESGTFANCDSVEEYNFAYHQAIPILSDVNAFENIKADSGIYVLETQHQDYLNDAKWSNFSSNFNLIGVSTNGVCENSIEKPILDLHIKGNSVQNGTPTPETPVEIKSVGERTKNLINYKDFIVSGKTKEIENGIQFETTGKRIQIAVPFTFKANTTYVISAECTEDGYFGGKLINEFNTYNWCDKNIKSFVIKNLADTDITESITCVDTTGTKGSTIKFAMLEINTSVTEYEPYGYKIPVKVNGEVTNIYLDEPLRKVGDYADYIDFKNGKVVRQVEKFIFSANNNWTLGSEPTNNGFYKNYIAPNYNGHTQMIKGTKVAGLCNILPSNKQYWNAWIEETAQFGQVNSVIYFITKNQYTSSADIYNYLSNNGANDVYVLYAKLTPTEEAIDLPQFDAINGTTTIEVLTSVQPSEIMVKYYK